MTRTRTRSMEGACLFLLIRAAKVAVIPLSPFYAQPPRMTLVRLCIAKRDETLRAAAERLRAFAQTAMAQAH